MREGKDINFILLNPNSPQMKIDHPESKILETENLLDILTLIK
jgi:hypothetical protein